MALLFISHNLAVVRHLCEDVVVLYLGRVVERAPRDALFADPRHPYTRALLAAVPEPDPRLASRAVAATVMEEGARTPPGEWRLRFRAALCLCDRSLPWRAAAAGGAGAEHAVACHRWRESAPT